MIGELGFGDGKVIAYRSDKVYVRLYKWGFWGPYTEIVLATNSKVLNIYRLRVKVEKGKNGWEIIDVCDD